MLLLALFSILSFAPDTRQPQLAADGSRVALTYGQGKTVMFALSRDGGASFSAPVQVGDGPYIALGRHRGPRVVFAGRTIVITAMVGMTPERGKDGDLLTWRSEDEGRTWQAGGRVNDVPNAAREGLHNMAAGPRGELFVTWLDLRTNAMQLYGAASRDGGKTWSKNVAIYTSPDGFICQCCHPSVAFDAQGTLFVMFRNALGGSRDMYLGTSKDGGRTFQFAKLGTGTWKLNACPMDGGGLVVTAKGPVTAWRRDKALFMPAGEAERKLGEGKDIALAVGPDGQTVAGWTEGMKIRVDGEDLGEGGFVSLTGDRQVVAAWESPEGIKVRRLR